ncbi:beta-ketoacyl synthase N-terminal-like domain-containing protein [Streptomyces sp. NPDC018045]|uniref:beta-ketoacyl synthase N-terminal-like domain-containing protein n=1 Tax=Streptomyces sp. NPDC018045 TaxID=3365037 RepID=UPI00379C8F26
MTQLVNKVLSLLGQGALDRAEARTLVGALQQRTEPSADAPIAVIGVAATLPGADCYENFWDVLIHGRDRVGGLPGPRQELCAPVIEPGTNPHFLTGGWLDDIDHFDNEFFSITPADARGMDPMQRRFLQVAYHCLEDAGWAGRIRGSRTGAFGSVPDGDYQHVAPLTSPADVPGRIGSFGLSRLSHWLDLRGPAFNVSCTCSSSLVALHLACQALRSGDCDMALVGGANILSFPVIRDSRLADASGIMSPAGKSQPFDTAADGVGRGEGVIALLLKPFKAAVRDRDRIRAVITASSVNNDGTSAMLTAPNPAAQALLLREAWRRAGWSPADIDYIEAHGTGTALGDPIEIKAVNDAVGAVSSDVQQIAFGTLKGNIGHLLDGAAGLAGLVKTMLVLEHQEVPPTVNLTEPSRHIDFLGSAVFVPTEPWPLRKETGAPLRAGVSCFGFNGTNAHVLVESPPAQPQPTASASGPLLLPLSARTPERLTELLRIHGASRTVGTPLADLAWSLAIGREHFTHRVAVLASTLDEFRAVCGQLADLDREKWAEIPGVLTAATHAEATPNRRRRIGLDWVRGGALDTAALFEGLQPRLVTAPGYPFAPTRFWPAARPTPPNATPAAPPQSGVERLGDDVTVLQICISLVQEVLGYDDVTAEDSFLALGGSSLAALQIQSALQQRYAVELSMADILAADCLSDLAELIQKDAS